MSMIAIRRVGSVGVLRRTQQIRSIPRALTWTGVIVAAVGFLLLAIAWGKTAGLLVVALQVPYIISAGCTGLGLVVLGVTLIGIDAKRHDSALRRAQLVELRELLAELRVQTEVADK